MKKVFFALASYFLLLAPIFAHESIQKPKKIDFVKMKEQRLERLDELRGCISRSTNFKELRTCKLKRYKKNKY